MAGQIVLPEVVGAPTSPAADLHKLYVDDAGLLTLMDDAGVESSIATEAYVDALEQGKVLQVVSATYSTEVSNSADSLADTGLSASITPTSTSSKILVLSTLPYKSDTQATGVNFELLRGATNLGRFAQNVSRGIDETSNYLLAAFGQATIIYLDSPSTTSATTYKVQFKPVRDTTSTAYINISGTCTSSMVLIEVAG